MFWVHLGQFRYNTKLGAERAELVQLMQKFMPWSRIRIFGQEWTRSTPLDPKLMFWCVLYHFGAFGTVLLHHKSRCRTAELVQLMQTFVPWSRIVIFPNERSRSSPFYSKLIYWCISYRLAAFETISLQHDSICKTSRNLAINAKVRALKLRRNFSQWRLPTHSNRH